MSDSHGVDGLKLAGAGDEGPSPRRPCAGGKMSDFSIERAKTGAGLTRPTAGLTRPTTGLTRPTAGMTRPTAGRA